MNKEEFGKCNLSEARRFLECFCKVECSEGTSYSGKSTELKEFDGKSSELKEYDGTSFDSKGNELKGSENSCGRINIRIFSDKKGTGFKGKNLSFNIKDFQSKSKVLMAHNEANRGIFFVVNSGGNSDRKINKINAQFFECDTLSLEEQLENISKFPLEPSIIVQTKKSLHVYFLIKNGKVEKFRDIQKKLAKHFNGDGSCINESRVMRVPGFYHCKEEPVRVKCIKFNPNLFYTQEDLERELSYSESEFIVNDDNYIRLESYISNYHSDLQESTLLNKENISEDYRKSISEKKSEVRNNKSKEQVLYESEENLHSMSEDNISKNNQLNIENTVDEEVKSENGLEVVCFKCDFINHCKKNSKILSEPLWHGMITNLALFKGGTYRIHELSKGYKTYSEKETEEKISNFLKSDAGPMTCETLRDRGYTCLRYGKTCYGKSPASLAFKPLTVKDIRECIKTLKVSEVSNAINVDTALRFIENYMYNIGVALGKSLIEEDLANHLKIKNSKDLISFYREVVRNFKNERGNKAKSKNKSKPKNSGNLPWYEEQEKGLKFLPFVLAKHLSETRDVYYGGESFLIYENGVYNISGEKEAGRIIMDYMLPNYCIMASIRDCREQWDILVSKDFDDFNRNPYLVNVRNGLLDIRDMSFKEHTPSYLSTVQLNVEYNPQVDCPQFKKFLNEVLDCKLIPLVQEIVGYLLTTNTASQKAFVFWGPARTGKSTLLWVVEYLLLGKKNVSNIPWQEIGDKFKTAELLGKLANVFSDLPSKSIDDTGIFKVVTGEDYLMAEKKNKNPFKFKPFARLVFSCNELPRNYVDRTEGFYRRLIIVPFNRQIEKSKIDKALKYKFQREKEGILNWALEGLKRLYENNFEFSENELTDGVKKEYKRENNNVISFVEECCELDGLFSCSRIEIYEAYKEFCVEAGLKALSQIKFNKELEGNFNITRSRSGKLRLWNGVRIKLDDLIIR
ncbi:phage/plasmid primase, P4 family [Clostridium perfringens]|uniref:DNA primase family protein n=1 Tax=Clostridium perfringens TaxID=1502 RepID=UPI0018E43F3E|nr:DNA primase family protein [Clostridium perfringens]MBI6101524.1 DNA primase [Clostridium perfringens]MDJ8955548.1 phage/plasmid primase, P4 family [Clostridium perfringens]MDK0545563.1 phage/plasmid primase, P4 family [Clostridium perfringens]MDK0972682.1 phage/plasmid primase, P4 family [Clostridium perfringens]MDM0896809.1 phage/plasmid primase, P4 family [Clostridium perfringens]